MIASELKVNDILIRWVTKKRFELIIVKKSLYNIDGIDRIWVEEHRMSTLSGYLTYNETSIFAHNMNKISNQYHYVTSSTYIIILECIFK